MDKYLKSLLFICLIFLLICIPRMDRYLYGDEFYQFSTSTSLIKGKGIGQYNFIANDNYAFVKESFLTTAIFSVSMFLFGTNEIAARIPSLIGGIALLIISFYFISYFFKDKKFAIIMSFFISTNTFIIFHSTNMRMYIFFMCFSLLYIYNLYRCKDNNKYFIYSLIIFIILFLLRPFALFYIPITIIYLLTLKKIPKYIKYIIIFLFIIFTILLSIYYKNYFGNFNIMFFSKSFLNINMILSLILISILTLSSKTKRIKFIIIVWALLQFQYMFLTYISFNERYISHIIILNFILIFYGFFNLYKKIVKNRMLVYIILFIFIIIINYNLSISNTFVNVLPEVERLNYYNVNRMFQFGDNYYDYNKINSIINNEYSTNMLIMGVGVIERSYYFQNVFGKDFKYIELLKSRFTNGNQLTYISEGKENI
jgi:4-amino-4-deoxy-L-arabinose transferase-like glycosyltransferase